MGSEMCIRDSTMAFGIALGAWRDPMQAVYSGIKLPLVLILTALGNGAINGMLAPLLGLPLRFQQSLAAVLASFATCGAILGGFSPLIGFLAWTSPPITTSPQSTAHQLLLVTLVIALSTAGVMGNLRLFQSLVALSQSRNIARQVLCAWLGLNLFLGSQISWLLRPFVGSPGLPVEFFRRDAFQGNFFESLSWSVLHLVTTPSEPKR